MKIIEVNGRLLEELQAVGRKTYTQHFSDIWSEKGLESYLEHQFNLDKLQHDLNTEFIKYFLISVDENFVGLLKLKQHQPLPKKFLEYGLEIEKVYLLQEFAGLGLGKNTLDFVFDYARKSDEKIVWLDVLKTNVKAIKFYEKQSFQIVDELDFSTDIRKLDMWVMRCEIS